MLRRHETKSFKFCRCCYKWRCQCLVPRRKRPHPPFNSRTRSDNKLGLHPNLRALPPQSPTVGSYNLRPILRKSKAVSWKREQEAALFSATRGWRLTKEIKFQKDLMKAGRGPGAYELPRWPEDIFDVSCKNLREDVSFGTVPRFESKYKSTTPGPGYILKVHNPYYYLDQKKLKGFSQVPTFEFDGLVSRFQEIKKCWSLPCNRYNVKHPHSLQAFLEKVTGKRGPYDLFTGPRDETTIKGYWTPIKLEDNGDWPRKLPGEIEKLLDKSNYFKGKWTTNPRFTKKPIARIMLQDLSMCYKDPDEPGPGYYDPRTPRKPSTFKSYPFNSNVEHVRPLPPRGIRPGPGRYTIKRDSSIKGQGWTCVFRSKVPRTIGAIIPPSYSDF